jgi:TolB-like protein
MESGRWFDELERRGVIASAIAYTVVALLVVQVGAATFEPLGLPRWTMTALISLGCVGFPAAIALAWFWNLTPDDRPVSPSLFADLARRGVFQVLAGYGAAAWLAIQAAQATFPYLGFPDWTIQAVIVGSIFGFPVAGLLAWRFEVTREAPSARTSRLRLGSPWIALSAGLLVSFASASTWGALIVPPFEERPGIAVLPLEDRSGTPDGANLAASMHGAMINEMTRFERLKVIAQNSVATVAPGAEGRSGLAESLGVRYLVEGAVRRNGDRLAVDARLLDAATLEVLWSDAYDRSFIDLTSLQREIAFDVARHASIHVSGPERTRGRGAGPTDPEALMAYLEGMEFYEERRSPTDPTKGANIRAAIAAFERATARAPDYAEAWAALGLMHSIRASSDWGEIDRDAHREAARLALAKAESLAPDLPELHLARVQYIAATSEDWNDIESEIRALLAVRPTDREGLRALSETLFNLARWEETEVAVRRAIAIDPKDFGFRYQLLQVLTALRRYDEAEVVIRDMAKLRSKWDTELNLALLGVFARGDLETYDKVIHARLTERRPIRGIHGFFGWWTALALGEPHKAIELTEALGSEAFPQSGIYEGSIAVAAFVAGDVERARRMLRKPTLEDCTRNPTGLRRSRAIYYRPGCAEALYIFDDLETALSVLDVTTEAMDRSSSAMDDVDSRYWLAISYGQLGQHAKATALMIKAFEHRSLQMQPWTVWLDYRTASLRQYPPFREFMRSQGVDVDRPIGRSAG